MPDDRHIDDLRAELRRRIVVTICHELGHALAYRADSRPLRVVNAASGYVWSGPLPATVQGRERTIAEITGTLAGPLAGQRLLPLVPQEVIESVPDDWLARAHELEGAVFEPTSAVGAVASKIAQSPRVSDEDEAEREADEATANDPRARDALLHECYLRARAVVDDNAALAMALVPVLIADPILIGDEFEEAIQRVEATYEPTEETAA